MESGAQRPFALIFLLGLLILTPQLCHLFTGQEPAAITSHPDTKLAAQLVQVGRHHPYLLFQPISVNNADAEQFVVIPGIGPALSQRIVAHRATYGPFHSLEELVGVPGIGPQKLASLKKYCRL